MQKRYKLTLMSIVAVAALLIAGLGSFALAQSGDGSQAPDQQGNHVSRHVDYDVNLQVNGDLSAVDAKLAGVLPLNLSAKGGADIQKGDSGPQVQGNLQFGGFDALIQKFASGSGANNGQAALGAGMIGSYLSDIQFVAIDKDVYVKLGGTWYDTAGMTKHGDGARPDENADNGAKDQAKACVETAFPGGPKALLKDVKTSQEDIDGVSTTHTTASVDIDKALTEASAAATSCGKADEAAKLEAAKAQIAGSIKTVNLEWWIDGDGQLRQAKAAVEVDPSALAPLVEQMAANKPARHGNGAVGAPDTAKIDAALKGITSVKLDATVKFSRFGEDFQIAKPDGDIKPLSDLMGMAGGCKHGRGGAGDGSDGSAWHKNGQGHHRGGGSDNTNTNTAI